MHIYKNEWKYCEYGEEDKASLSSFLEMRGLLLGLSAG